VEFGSNTDKTMPTCAFMSHYSDCYFSSTKTLDGCRYSTPRMQPLQPTINLKLRESFVLTALCVGSESYTHTFQTHKQLGQGRCSGSQQPCSNYHRFLDV